jgi:hypothetical protein
LDYSPNSIALCKQITVSKNVDISFFVYDILSDSNSTDSASTGFTETTETNEPKQTNPPKYKLALDKGTFDAISLSTEINSTQVYIERVSEILDTDGILLLTSCNWTDNELVQKLEQKYIKII